MKSYSALFYLTFSLSVIILRFINAIIAYIDI